MLVVIRHPKKMNCFLWCVTVLFPKKVEICPQTSTHSLTANFQNAARKIWQQQQSQLAYCCLRKMEAAELIINQLGAAFQAYFSPIKQLAHKE